MQMTWEERAKAQIRRHEGARPDPYLDTGGKITIGVGRCLSTKPLRETEIEFLYMLDFEDAVNDAHAFVGDACFDGLTDARKVVLVDMAFNLGLRGLQQFTKFLTATKEGRWSDAAREILDSRLAKGRATELARQMEVG